jgi:hypothetical protein
MHYPLKMKSASILPAARKKGQLDPVARSLTEDEAKFEAHFDTSDATHTS